MRTDKRQNTNPTNAVRGPIIETRRVQDGSTKGNTEWDESQLVQHQSEPLEGRFGLLSSTISNERNTNKSYRNDVYVDVEDLHTRPTQGHKGIEQLGGDDVLVGELLVDITEGLPTREKGNLIISDEVEGIDRFHGKKVKESVVAWEPRTEVVKGDPDAGGVDTTVTKQVVAAATSWPTVTVATLGQSREQLGYDKFLQSVKTANSTIGTLTAKDSFGLLGAQTITTETKVGLDYVFPTPGVNVIAHTLKQLDGFKMLYSKTELVDGWPTLVSYEEEPVTGKKVTITRTVHGSAPSMSTNGTARFVTDIDHASATRWTKTVREIDSSITSETFIEYHTVEYYFPPYLDRTTPFRISSTESAPNKSGRHTLKVPCRFEITYISAPVSPVDVFQFKTVNIDVTARVVVSGFLTDIRLVTGDVITNGATLGTPSVTIPASSPTSTELWTMMGAGTEVTIADDTTKWKFNLWRRTKVIMKMPDRQLVLT